MRDILKRVFIGVAIGMALFFLKTEVFALTVGTPQMRMYYSKNGTSMNTSYQNAGTTQTITFASRDEVFLDGILIKFNVGSGTNGFVANTGYTITFTLNTNYLNVLNNGYSLLWTSGSGDCRASSSGNNMNFTCFYFPSSNTSSVSLGLYPQYPTLYTSPFTMNLSTSNFTISSNANSDDMITEIVSGIAGGVSGIGNALNVSNTNTSILALIQENYNNFMIDVMSSTYNGHRNLQSIDPYNQSGLEGKDTYIYDTTHDFTLDTETFAGPFDFIWYVISLFFDLDPIFMSAIVFILTLSFASLVVGRL